MYVLCYENLSGFYEAKAGGGGVKTERDGGVSNSNQAYCPLPHLFFDARYGFVAVVLANTVAFDFSCPNPKKMRA